MSSEIYVAPEVNQNTSFINRVRSITRKCSFCNCQGHNISSCNDQHLLYVYEYLNDVKNETLIRTNNNRLMAIPHMEKFIYDFCSQFDNNCHTKLIKAVACRFCYSRINSPLQVSINKIIQKLFQLDLSLIETSQYNFIPFTTESPVRISVLIDRMIFNFIENNPIISGNEIKPITPNVEYSVILDTGLCVTSNDETVNEEKYVSEPEPEMECSICYNSTPKKMTAKLECAHEFCIDCTENLMKKKYDNCPYCRNKIDKIICYNKESFNKLNLICYFI